MVRALIIGVLLKDMVFSSDLNDFWVSIFPFFEAPPGFDAGAILGSAEIQTQLVGAWWFLGLFVVMMVFNSILGEEFLFRGVLLPKMNGVFGKWDWVVNGVLPEIFFLIAAFSASLAGVILTAIVSGRDGLRKMFRRLLIWRAGIGWWIFAVFALGLMYLGGIVLAAIFTGSALEIPMAQPLYMFFTLLIMQFFTDSGLGEVLGWRGFLLPRLQARYNALVSSIIVGITWGLWHLPLFLVEGYPPYYELGQAFGVVPALIGFSFFITVPWAILFTWLYNNTKGSLLLAFVFHAAQACFAILVDPNKPLWLSLPSSLFSSMEQRTSLASMRGS